jgi:hypothetical protein
MRDIFFAKMVKLTNSLVESRTHKFWHSFYVAVPSDKKHSKLKKKWINKKIHCFCVKSVLDLVPKETVRDGH